MSKPAHGLPDQVESRHPGWPAWLGPLRVRAGTVAVRPVRLRDGQQWSAVRVRDQHYLERWEPTVHTVWAERNAPGSWLPQWMTLRRLARRGECLPFTITVDDAFAGQITVGNVIRGSLCSAWIGYWVASTNTSGGVATAAVALVVDHVFAAAGLHRLEATVRPENRPSVRVLEKAGFRQEGLFRRYLDVAGDWRDHLCFAITREDVADGGVTRALISSGRAGRG